MDFPKFYKKFNRNFKKNDVFKEQKIGGKTFTNFVWEDSVEKVLLKEKIDKNYIPVINKILHFNWSLEIYI